MKKQRSKEAIEPACPGSVELAAEKMPVALVSDWSEQLKNLAGKLKSTEDPDSMEAATNEMLQFIQNSPYLSDKTKTEAEENLNKLLIGEAITAYCCNDLIKALIAHAAVCEKTVPVEEHQVEEEHWIGQLEHTAKRLQDKVTTRQKLKETVNKLLEVVETAKSNGANNEQLDNLAAEAQKCLIGKAPKAAVASIAFGIVRNAREAAKAKRDRETFLEEAFETFKAQTGLTAEEFEKLASPNH